MATKIFSAYSRKERSSEMQLVVEWGSSHIACIVTDGVIEDFELFKIESDREASEVFLQVLNGSPLLGKNYVSSKVYVHNETALIVPATYNKQDGEEYLDVVYGENEKCKVITDNANSTSGFVTVYRVPLVIAEVINQKFGEVTIEHSYTRIINKLFNHTEELPAHLLKVQFYYNHIIAVLVMDKKLQLIQTFNYETNADVIYYLLNIARQFAIDIQKPKVWVSGIIDPQSSMFSELKMYFEHVSVENVEPLKSKVEMREFPSHYFTPFYNLAE